MKRSSPKVSIGLPVYNGERYLEAAVNSILDQSYDDFELIISDNASGDATPDICRYYLERDKRIRFVQNEKNLGATWNFNRVLHLSTGEYFKWASYDDLCATDFIGKCVEVLDRFPDVTLCYTKIADIDETGEILKIKSSNPCNCSDNLQERFHSLIRMDYTCEQIFGLIRSNVLKKTKLIGAYSDTDRVLLSELCLYGRFYEIQEALFFHRIHSQSSVKLFRGRHERTAWFDPFYSGIMVFPYWRQLKEYVSVINRSSLPRKFKRACYLEMGRWLKNNHILLLKDMHHNIKQMIRTYSTYAVN